MEARGDFELTAVGLPILSYEEFQELEICIGFEDPKIETPITYFGRAIPNINPRIDSVIEYDAYFFTEYETSEHEKPEDIRNYLDGLEDGYAFVIGVFTYVRFMRSGYATIEEYLSDIAGIDGALPVSTKNEEARIKLIRRGSENDLLDITTKELIDTSDELATLETGDYIFNAHYLETIKNLQLERLYAKSKNSNKATSVVVASILATGFESGFCNAVGMYIQSEEQRVLDAVQSTLQ